MKNIARQMKPEKTTLSLVENKKGNKSNNNQEEKMKQHLIAIMEAIAEERQRDNVINMY